MIVAVSNQRSQVQILSPLPVRTGSRRTSGSPFPRVGKAAMSAALAAVAGPGADPDGTRYPEGTEWRDGDRVWWVERLRRRDVLDSDPALRAVLGRLREPGRRGVSGRARRGSVLA
jgi:hypothetical protein